MQMLVGLGIGIGVFLLIVQLIELRATRRAELWGLLVFVMLLTLLTLLDASRRAWVQSELSPWRYIALSVLGTAIAALMFAGPAAVAYPWARKGSRAFALTASTVLCLLAAMPALFFLLMYSCSNFGECL